MEAGKQDKIVLENVEYTYRSHHEGIPGVLALSGINVSIDKGQFVVVIGRNGSGKSTFAKLLNALLLPTCGCVYIRGMNSADHDKTWDIRRSVGMIFQNPDNQIIGTSVDEDVAFGPENLGMEPEKIRQSVYDALKMAGIEELSNSAPHMLSGGQKQRVAIAGILAMKPECIVLDEATSMLDPVGRREVMKVLGRLNKEEKITVIHITHNMDEAAAADRVIVVDDGHIVLDGLPGEVFSNVRKIKEIGLDVPQVTELLSELNEAGYEFPLDIMDVEKAYEALCTVIGSGK